MSTTIDYDAVKAKQQSAWASGDYAVIGTTLQLVGELLAEACEIRWDEDVLDVAAGNGNATLAAARRGGNVTSTDYVMDLLDRGAERAAAEGLNVTFALADAEALPFADATFDVVLSTFGVMFAPNHELPHRSSPASAAPAAASGSPTGHPRASWGRCSASSAGTCRRRPACSLRHVGRRRAPRGAVRWQHRVDGGDAA